MNDYIDIFQLNNQKRLNSMDYIRLLTNQSKRFIVFGQECNINREKPAGLDSRHKLIYNSDDPKAYIYHHKDLNTWQTSQMNDKYVSSAIWETGNTIIPRLMLISLYWESRDKDINENLIKILDYCKLHRLPILIGTDANCKSTLGNCVKTCTRGNKLEQLMSEYGLMMANQGDSWP